MVEYALVVALVATVCIVGFQKLGKNVKEGLSKAGENVVAAADKSSEIVQTGLGKLEAMMS